jgi:hypothetical protein
MTGATLELLFAVFYGLAALTGLIAAYFLVCAVMILTRDMKRLRRE